MSQENRNALISRIGTFFIILGLLGIILFVASDMAERTTFSYFFGALLSLGFGFALKRANPVPRPDSNRFEGVRKWQKKRQDAKSEKQKNVKR